MHGMHSLMAFGWFAAYLGSGLAMLAIFTKLYMVRTPYDEAKDIREGKVAPAIALVGAMLGFTLPVLAASYSGLGLIDYLGWAATACLVQLAVFEAMHRLLPNQISTNNTAAALVFAGTSVAAGLINAFSMLP